MAHYNFLFIQGLLWVVSSSTFFRFRHHVHLHCWLFFHLFWSWKLKYLLCRWCRPLSLSNRNHIPNAVQNLWKQNPNRSIPGLNWASWVKKSKVSWLAALPSSRFSLEIRVTMYNRATYGLVIMCLFQSERRKEGWRKTTMGWWDASVVKRTGCTARGSEFSSQHAHQAAHSYP